MGLRQTCDDCKNFRLATKKEPSGNADQVVFYCPVTQEHSISGLELDCERFKPRKDSPR